MKIYERKTKKTQYSIILNEKNDNDDEVDNIQDLIFRTIQNEGLDIIARDYGSTLYKITVSEYYSDRCGRKVIKLNKLINIQKELKKYNLNITWLSVDCVYNLVMLIITYNVLYNN